MKLSSVVLIVLNLLQFITPGSNGKHFTRMFVCKTKKKKQ